MTETINVASVVEQHLPFLRRYGRALTGSQASGDRYAALTLEAILADRSVLDEVPDPRTGLFRTFHAVWSSSGAQIEAAAADGNPLEIKLQDRLAKLTPNTREAVLLKMLEGFAVEDIALVLDVDDEEAGELIEIGLNEMRSQIASRVLIIEDEPIIAMDIEAIVSDMGHSCVGIARTEGEATALAREARFDIVLADINLADGSSGIDAVKTILTESGNLPVIFITAYPERLLTGERPEPTYLITKPFDEEQVRSSVSQALFFASTGSLSDRGRQGAAPSPN
jgi:CheY-like chemotaxis protein/DNA-directed RNA polymerase specialized sigma24 family protein